MILNLEKKIEFNDLRVEYKDLESVVYECLNIEDSDSFKKRYKKMNNSAIKQENSSALFEVLDLNTNTK